MPKRGNALNAMQTTFARLARRLKRKYYRSAEMRSGVCSIWSFLRVGGITITSIPPHAVEFTDLPDDQPIGVFLNMALLVSDLHVGLLLPTPPPRTKGACYYESPGMTRSLG